MPIDSNIALGVRPIEQPNMLGQMGQMMALKAAQQESEGYEGVKNALAGGMDASDPRLLQYGKRGIEAFKAAGEGKIKQLEAGEKQTKMLGSIFGGVMQDPSTGPSAVSQLVKMGVIKPEEAQQVIAQAGNDPTAWKALATQHYQQAISAENRMSDERSRLNSQLQSETSIKTTGMTNATTRRGQDLTDIRARQELHPIETGTGPGTYQKFGPNAGVINPMTQAPWQAPNAPPPVAPMQGPNALPATVGAAPQTNMLNAPPASAGGYTQAQPKGPTSVINVNTQIPASEEAQKEFMKSSRATYDQLKQASTVLDNIEKAKALVPTAKGFMGTGGETMLETAKFMNNRLGTSIDTAGIKSAEELNSRLFMGIMDNLKKMDAQPSQQQQAAMKQALGNLGTDPSAMNSVLDVFGDIVRGKVDIHNQEVTGAEQRGVKFPYNPVIKLPEKTAASVAVPSAAVDMLKSNPALKSQFEAKYGKGSADSYLGK